MWLFYLYSTVKIRLLYLVFPWRNLWLGHFVGYSFGTLKKKHQPVSMTQPFLILKEWAVKCLSHKAHKRNNWRKNGMFSPYCGDETTTPSDRAFRFYPWLYDRKRFVPYFWLCHKKWSMLFPWSSKGTNKMPQPWTPTTGKLDKKAAFSSCCGGEITTHI